MHKQIITRKAAGAEEASGLRRLPFLACVLMASTLVVPAVAHGRETAPIQHQHQHQDRPALSQRITTVSEGVPGGVARILLTLREPTRQRLVVSWRTVDGSAKAGKDFRRDSGTAVFKAGTTQAAVRLKVIDDERGEPTEQLTVKVVSKRLRNASARQVVQLTDDDPAVRRLVGTLTIHQIEEWNDPDIHRLAFTQTLTLSLVRQGRVSWVDDGHSSWTTDYSERGRAADSPCEWDRISIGSGSGDFSDSGSRVEVAGFMPDLADNGGYEPYLEERVTIDVTRRHWWQEDCHSTSDVSDQYVEPYVGENDGGPLRPVAELIGDSPSQRGLRFAYTYSTPHPYARTTTVTGTLRPAR